MGQAWEDYCYWQSEDPSTVETIDLIEEIRGDPWKGKGKPELLKGNWKDSWSRQINLEHRLVYRLFDMDKPSKGQGKLGKISMIQFAQCRYHYDR